MPQPNVGVPFIGEFALEPTDQLPGRVEILFHIPEFGCGRGTLPWGARFIFVQTFE
jgi:hypothetical protein